MIRYSNQNCNSLLLVLGMTLCPLVAQSQNQGKPSSRYENSDTFRISGMTLSCEVPGATLDVVYKGQIIADPMEAFERIRVTHGGQSIILQQLNDLRGHVRIADDQTALRYVRLLTSPETWFLWKNGKPAVEILEAKEALALPNYGLHRQWLGIFSPVKTEPIKGGGRMTYWTYDQNKHAMELTRHTFQKRTKVKHATLETRNPPDLTILGDGHMGVLNRKAYLAGNFSPPSVVPVNGGFQVVRWLFVRDHVKNGPKESVQKVQEFVGADGEYRQTVLNAISPPPNLPNIHFGLWMFR